MGFISWRLLKEESSSTWKWVCLKQPAPLDRPNLWFQIKINWRFQPISSANIWRQHWLSKARGSSWTHRIWSINHWIRTNSKVTLQNESSAEILESYSESPHSHRGLFCSSSKTLIGRRIKTKDFLRCFEILNGETRHWGWWRCWLFDIQRSLQVEHDQSGSCA